MTLLAAAERGDNDPKNATEWFQRADDQMNLRMPGSTPFHMKVTFHALPGLVLDKEKSSRIISGDGTYEETWVAPRRWRREVTLDSYHAIEVMNESARKMQASSDYEPSRVLMLLEALLYPVPRDLSSPFLSEAHPKWKIESGAAHNISYVKISHTSGLHDIAHAYLFLPRGFLVQSVEVGLVTSWQEQTIFGGKVVPGHFDIQGGTRNLLNADVMIEPAGTVDPAAFELPGEPAEPGMTLRPMHGYDSGISIPNTSYSIAGSEGFRGIIRQILDRHGVTREVEVLDSPSPDAAEALLRLIRGDRFHPATTDKSPCEIAIWKSF
ncbi:MAG: hypothetical protein ACLPHP_20710 [Candidatus Sulfotelmatobacter sp.]